MVSTMKAGLPGIVGPLALLLTFVAAMAPALGQQPSQEQIAAVRAACRSDYIEHCSGVPTGGAASLACLRQNEAELSGPCRQAVTATAGGATTAPPPMMGPGSHSGAMPGGMAPPTTPPPGAGMELFREECGMDVRRICHGVFPGGGRVVGCLLENREHLSPACREAMMELRERR
jgi:hypothetical protein